MVRWVSLKRLTRGQPKARQGELERAYRSVFLCPEGQVVLADLAAECGMYLAPASGLTPDQRTFADGRKALFGRILACIRVTPEEHAALQQAARLESTHLPEDDY